jgi:hypothetical protein
MHCWRWDSFTRKAISFFMCDHLLEGQWRTKSLASSLPVKGLQLMKQWQCIRSFRPIRVSATVSQIGEDNMDEQFYVDERGSVWSTVVGEMHLSIARLTDTQLLEGKYERSGFGMTEREKRAAIALRELGELVI